MAVVTFGPSNGSHYSAVSPVVSWRASWADAWTVRSDLDPVEAVWSVAPTLSVATLEYHYGEVAGPGVANYAIRTRDNGYGLVNGYVRIAYGNRTWYGVVEEVTDQQYAEADGVDRGIMEVKCYGMEKLLADHVILNSVMDDPPYKTIPHPIGFNVEGPLGIKGNRSANVLGQTYVFSNDGSSPGTWSSRQIARYLIEHQTPRNHVDVIIVPFELVNEEAIPDWDLPLLPIEDGTTFSVLSQVIDRRRALAWWCDVDEDTNRVQVKIETLAETPVSFGLPLSVPLPANQNIVDIVATEDELTGVSVSLSSLPTYQQVVARGARMRHVGSFSFEDSTLESAWGAALETRYEAGGSPHPANTPKKRKQTRNADARSSPDLADVYSLFKVPDDWDYRVGDGEGGATAPLFLNDLDVIQEQYRLGLYFEQSLPLLAGVDYGTDKIPNGTVDESTGNDEELSPFVVLQRPQNANRWHRADQPAALATERVNDQENERLRAVVSIPRRSRSVRVRVVGQPQHAIAKTDFTRQAEDPFVGDYDYKTGMILTASMEASYFAEARYPENEPSGYDAIRYKIIYYGEQYTRHYVAPDTVVGVDVDGELVRSDGGYLPAKSDSDNVSILAALAKIAAQWYLYRHDILSLSTYRLPSAATLDRGYWVRSANGINVGGIISEIRINTPTGETQASPPSLSLVTWSGELDAVGFTPALPDEKPQRVIDKVADPVPFNPGRFGPDGREVR